MLPPYLTDAYINDLFARALTEDIGTGDVTTLATIPASTSASAYFLAKANGVLAGRYLAERVFSLIDRELVITWTHSDGASLVRGTMFGTVQGAARSILMGERLALNLMQRMSGIATATNRMQAATHPHKARILDTRKTAPGLRLLDKWAVLLGGGENHRLGLYDQILIKDNHIAAVGNIQAAIEAARRYRDEHNPRLKIQIEARTLDEVRKVVNTGGVDALLLDNMARPRADGSVDVSLLHDAVTLVSRRYVTEASGNVTLRSIPAIAATGVDFISSGALTHSVAALDISLEVTLQ
jgi:nicotinate-nucleotide pyrophosphorylase (carboxylating)